MKRLLILTVTAAVLVSTVTAAGASASSPVKLSLRKTSVGTILVDSSGFTVYAFTRDVRNQETIAGDVRLHGGAQQQRAPSAPAGQSRAFHGEGPR